VSHEALRVIKPWRRVDGGRLSVRKAPNGDYAACATDTTWVVYQFEKPEERSEEGITFAEGEAKSLKDARAIADAHILAAGWTLGPVVVPPPSHMACIYIAGPYSGEDGWEIACNVHRAEALAREVVRLGAAPITPHSIGARMAGTETYEFWCLATMEMMRRCDAVMFTVGWEMSKGARGEHREATRLQMPCFFDIAESAEGLLRLKAWLEGRLLFAKLDLRAGK
jgi:hypothetical protein